MVLRAESEPTPDSSFFFLYLQNLFLGIRVLLLAVPYRSLCPWLPWAWAFEDCVARAPSPR